jgi:hypothetical protein
MIGHRPSSLPIAQYCAPAAIIGAAHGSGRAAAMSTAWHARCAGSLNAEELFARLSPKEQDEVKGWPKPKDVILEDGLLLSYTTAVHEFKTGIDGFGDYEHPDSDTCLTGGTLDFAWEKDGVAYVADLKKSKFTCVDGPDSLQLQAYGWGYARFRGCHSYITGLWIAETGEWEWAKKAATLDSPEGELIIKRVVAAASNKDPKYQTGPHCANCYSRTHCPEHLLGAATVGTWLEPLSKGDAPAPDVAKDLIGRIKAAAAILEKAEQQIKAWCREGTLIITDADGKVYGPVMSKGRKTLNREALDAAFGASVIAEYEKQGAPYEQGWRFLKPKGEGK